MIIECGQSAYISYVSSLYIVSMRIVIKNNLYYQEGLLKDLEQLKEQK